VRLLEQLLAMPLIPGISMPPVPFDFAEKLHAIADQMGDRPVAWVDDLIENRAYEWASTRSAPTLLLATDPAVGLRRDDVDTLLSWRAEIVRPA
jgi:hypothetical protein